ncbi:MAG: response regulator, partial [Deltaproteobacteria bacterium]|nr:response regulator [Deltaproteobacteria bacterium]
MIRPGSSAAKYLLLLGVYLAFVVGLTLVWGLEERRRVLELVDVRLRAAASALPNMLARDFHDRARGPGDIGPDEEMANRDRFNRFAENNGLAYVYTLTANGDDFFFTAPTVTAEEALEKESWYFHPYDDAPPEFVRGLRDMRPVFLSYTDQWGDFRTCCLPGTSPGGVRYLTCADVETTEVRNLFRRYLVIVLAVAVAMALFVVPFIFITRRFYRRNLALVEAKNRELEEQRSNLEALVEARTASLREAKNRAERATDFKSRFLAQMSHEIRTPLHSVLGLTDLLRRTALDDGQERLVRGLGKAGELLQDLVTDILDHTRLEEGKLILEPKPFRPREVLEGVRIMYAGLAEDKGLSFDVEVADEVPVCLCGDRCRYQQILGNLVSNALKFTTCGQVSVRVDLVREEGERIVIQNRVQDTGLGIPEAERARLFESFRQMPGTATISPGGSGLGLSIVKALTEMMGGTVTVESETGKGSTFTVILPMDRARDEDCPQETPKDRPVRTDRPLKILVAEDNIHNEELYRFFLAGTDIGAEYARDGLRAVEAFSRNDFDVVVLDLQMPVLDGLGAARKIRALEAETGRARTPLVLLSAQDMGALASEDARLFEAILSKPIGRSNLLGAIVTLARAENRPASERVQGPDVARAIRSMAPAFLAALAER